MTVFLMRPGFGYRRVVLEGVSHRNVRGVAPVGGRQS